MKNILIKLAGIISSASLLAACDNDNLNLGPDHKTIAESYVKDHTSISLQSLHEMVDSDYQKAEDEIYDDNPFGTGSERRKPSCTEFRFQTCNVFLLSPETGQFLREDADALTAVNDLKRAKEILKFITEKGLPADQLKAATRLADIGDSKSACKTYRAVIKNADVNPEDQKQSILAAQLKRANSACQPTSLGNS